jgi:glycine/D-amino acid oxidase-like deaminating enzyme
MLYDFLIIGAGIFGLTTAIELRKKKYRVGILNPGRIPHPLAESTDISKIVRMEYGTDEEYMDMAAASIIKWKEWNDFFGDTLYHETGFLLLSREPLDPASTSFESASYYLLIKKGYTPERIPAELLKKIYPAFNHQEFAEGFYHARGGYAESGRVVNTLVTYARQLGVDVHEEQTAQEIRVIRNKAEAVKTREGKKFTAGNIIVCAGNQTPYLVPDLHPYMSVTGHPVFHLQPQHPGLFTFPQFTVFAAAISQTGWYGFPLHPRENVVKIARHDSGIILHDPEKDERIVQEKDIVLLRKFLTGSIPSLAASPVVFTRLCCYTDTLDGHFWIDRHPQIKGLTIGSGGSGHAFKMAPVIGEMIATVAESGKHPKAARYSWRHLDQATTMKEEARCKK